MSRRCRGIGHPKMTGFEIGIIMFVGFPLYLLFEHPLIFWSIFGIVAIVLTACFINGLRKLFKEKIPER